MSAYVHWQWVYSIDPVQHKILTTPSSARKIYVATFTHWHTSHIYLVNKLIHPYEISTTTDISGVFRITKLILKLSGLNLKLMAVSRGKWFFIIMFHVARIYTVLNIISFILPSCCAYHDISMVNTISLLRYNFDKNNIRCMQIHI